MLIKVLAGQENISNEARFFLKFYIIGLGIKILFFRL
jgi:hypothetical protein